MSRAPLLVFGWGNPSRGDDALGPLFVEELAARLDAGDSGTVELLTDFQLQVEHALDLVGRKHVLFVDASSAGPGPFELSSLSQLEGPAFTTHAMSPQALMQVFRQLRNEDPPPCILLAIRGQAFELGQDLSASARRNLAMALDWASDWMRTTP